MGDREGLGLECSSVYMPCCPQPTPLAALPDLERVLPDLERGLAEGLAPGELIIIRSSTIFSVLSLRADSIAEMRVFFPVALAGEGDLLGGRCTGDRRPTGESGLAGGAPGDGLVASGEELSPCDLTFCLKFVIVSCVCAMLRRSSCKRLSSVSRSASRGVTFPWLVPSTSWR